MSAIPGFGCLSSAMDVDEENDLLGLMQSSSGSEAEDGYDNNEDNNSDSDYCDSDYSALRGAFKKVGERQSEVKSEAPATAFKSKPGLQMNYMILVCRCDFLCARFPMFSCVDVRMLSCDGVIFFVRQRKEEGEGSRGKRRGRR